MLAELSIIPVGNGGQPNQELAEVLKVVDSSGLPYQLTLATCIEGEWSEIMDWYANVISARVQLPRMSSLSLKSKMKEEETYKLASSAPIEGKASRKLKTDTVVSGNSDFAVIRPRLRPRCVRNVKIL
jgi:uncharacterized protein YqgV (UPF0045/DUF77 family)